MVCRHCPFKHDAEIFPASSRTSKDSCGPGLTNRGCNNLLTLTKTMKRCLNSSNTYGKVSRIIRFVHDPATLVSVNEDNR